MKIIFAITFVFALLTLTLSAQNKVFLINSKIQDFYPSQIEYSISDPQPIVKSGNGNVREHELWILVSRTGALVFSKRNDKNFAISIYKAGDYCADIMPFDTRTIAIRPNETWITALEPIHILLHAMENSDFFIKELQKQAAKAKTKLNISNSAIDYSDGKLKHIIFLKDGKIKSASDHTLKGEKLAELRIEKKRSTNESEFTLQIYNKGKLETISNATIKLKKIISDEEAARLFDIYDGGMYRFIDRRLPPHRIYEYDGGIPPVDIAADLPISQEKIRSLQGRPSSEIEAGSYIEKVKKFFDSLK